MSQNICNICGANYEYRNGVGFALPAEHTKPRNFPMRKLLCFITLHKNFVYQILMKLKRHTLI